MRSILTTSLFTLTLTCLAACGGGDTTGHSHDHDAIDAFASVSKAVCVLSPTDNADLPSVTGTVTFTQTKNGVLVEANVTGLKPNSKHGFHVHQWGDIGKPDGTATGGHYDPTGSAEHGLPDVHEHDGHTHATTGGHAGDFGNLETDADGVASYTQTFEDITLTGHNAILGRAIIVHIKEDDGGQPTGNAGARVAQGVIGIANPD
ncbi:MAG: superoxide dismutase family protein [Phycisphaeraceae bacterium]